MTERLTPDIYAVVDTIAAIAADRVNWPTLDGRDGRGDVHVCPLCALAQEVDPEFHHPSDWYGASKVLRLDTLQAKAIMMAADSLSDGSKWERGSFLDNLRKHMREVIHNHRSKP